LKPCAPEAEVSTRSFGKFRLDRRLDRRGAGGAFSTEVWKAFHPELERDCVLKFLGASAAEPPEALERFRQEAKLLAELRHEHIVPILDAGSEPRPYLVLPFLDGESLRERLARGRLEPAAALTIAAQLGSALVYLKSREIVHRDIKPENIILTTSVSGELVAMLIDFGVALSGSTRLTEDGVIVGTRQYLAPEQCIPNQPLDGQADVYQLGCVLLEMLTGRAYCDDGIPPDDRLQFHRNGGRETPELNQHAPAIAALVRRMLRVVPHERPRLDDLPEALRSLANTTATRTTRSLPAIEAIRIPASRALRLSSVVVALGAFVAGVVVWRVGVSRPSARWYADSMLTPLVRLEGGTFEMGRSEAEQQAQIARIEHERPESARSLFIERVPRQRRKTVHLKPFAIEKREQTNALFAEWLNTVPGVHVRPESDGPMRDRYVVDGEGRLLYDRIAKPSGGIDRVDGRWQARRGFEHMPVEAVTPYAATKFCKAIGRHLPTEEQWEYAARGDTPREFPWGNERPECTRAVFDRRAFTRAEAKEYVEGLVAECRRDDAGPDDVLTPTSDKTPEGVESLCGNVSELTASTMDGAGGAAIVFRGSNYRAQYELCITSWRSRMPAETARLGVGFRCVE